MKPMQVRTSKVVCKLIVVWLALVCHSALGQSSTQLQYTYDAAGNLIQVTSSVVASQPELTVSNLAVGVISRNSNGSFNIAATFQVNNIGAVPAIATWYDRGYLSANAVLEDTDQALGGFNTRATNLAAGSSYAVSATFTTTTATAPGSYYLIVKADGGTAASGQYSPTGSNNVPESSESNNTQIVALNLPSNLQPDLTVSNSSVGTIAVNQNGAYVLPVTYTVNNVGLNAAPAGWYNLAYLSTDTVLDNADLNLSGYHYRNTPLEPGSSFTVTTDFSTTTTTVAANYTLFVKADGRGTAIGGGTNTDNGVVLESSETNNAQVLAITLPTKPDLAVSNLVVGTITSMPGGGYSIPVTFTVTNLGTATAKANWYDLGYLSADGALDNADQVLLPYTSRSTDLAGGANYVENITFSTSSGTVAGTYTLFVKADGRGGSAGGTITDSGSVTEPSDANNVASAVVQLNADLAVSNLVVGTITSKPGGGYSIPVTFTVTNLGTATAKASWYDLGYLSADGALDNADQVLLPYTSRSTDLAGGANYVENITFSTSSGTVAGTYTLFVKADGRGGSAGGTITDSGSVTEPSDANNVASAVAVLP